MKKIKKNTISHFNHGIRRNRKTTPLTLTLHEYKITSNPKLDHIFQICDPISKWSPPLFMDDSAKFRPANEHARIQREVGAFEFCQFGAGAIIPIEPGLNCRRKS